MPTYEYFCSSGCGTNELVYMDLDSPMKPTWDSGAMFHAHADGTFHAYKRRFSFSTPVDPIGDGYYDHSAGTYVTSPRQLSDHNKRASEAATERLGVEHKFVSRRIEDLGGPVE